MSEIDRGTQGPGPICFPQDFLWGAATSAYQIEGSPLVDGAGPSNWHRFAHSSGRTLDGDTGDVACDHYRRCEEDVAIMVDLGLGAYRFSISWSRILPEGRGSVNQAGIDFYARLVDLLLQNGIEPLVTLYHWDHPVALDELGGWLNGEIVDWFTDYARVMFRALGDRVSMWATLNEPWVIVDAGYLHGTHPPGHTDRSEVPIAARNLLLAHGSAVQAYRSEWPHQIGLVVNLAPKDPASGNAQDIAAADRDEAYMNRQFLDPALLGQEPQGLKEIFGTDWLSYSDDELRLIRQPIDFLGINYYTRGVVRHDPAASPIHATNVVQANSVYTETGWEVYANGLTRILCWVRDRYGEIPLYVTENGAAFADPPRASGHLLQDPQRVAYYRSHLRAAQAAIREGVDLRGYFAWSLLDNFEWASGYSKRFGIVHVDFVNQVRTLKASAELYREVIRTNGGVLTDPALPG